MIIQLCIDSMTLAGKFFFGLFLWSLLIMAMGYVFGLIGRTKK